MIFKAVFNLFCALMLQDSRHCQEDEFEIEEEGTLWKVCEFFFLSFSGFIVNVASAIDLPVSGQSGRDGEKLLSLIPSVVFFQFDFGNWSWTDEGNIAYEDVEELWKLVKRCLSEESSNLGDSRIIIKFSFNRPSLHLFLIEIFSDVAFRIGIHASEFQNCDSFSFFSDSMILEEDSSFRRELDNQRENEEKGGKKKNGKRRHKNIKNSLADIITLRSSDFDWFMNHSCDDSRIKGIRKLGVRSISRTQSILDADWGDFHFNCTCFHILVSVKLRS